MDTLHLQYARLPQAVWKNSVSFNLQGSSLADDGGIDSLAAARAVRSAISSGGGFADLKRLSGNECVQGTGRHLQRNSDSSQVHKLQRSFETWSGPLDV